MSEIISATLKSAGDDKNRHPLARVYVDDGIYSHAQLTTHASFIYAAKMSDGRIFVLNIADVTSNGSALRKAIVSDGSVASQWTTFSQIGSLTCASRSKACVWANPTTADIYVYFFADRSGN